MKMASAGKLVPLSREQRRAVVSIVRAEIARHDKVAKARVEAALAAVVTAQRFRRAGVL